MAVPVVAVPVVAAPVVAVPVVAVPVVAVPDGGLNVPGGRAGSVTPWLFKQATSAARLAVALPLDDEPVEAAEATAVFVALVLLEALPQAAIKPLAATTASASGAPRRTLLIVFTVLLLS